MAEQSIADQSASLRAIAEGQRPAEAVSPLEIARQNARRVIDKYVGPLPKKGEEKPITDEVSSIWKLRLEEYSLKGDFKKTCEYMKLLQNSGRLDSVDTQSWMLYVAAREQLDNIAELPPEGRKDNKDYKEIAREIARAQFAIIKASHTK